MRVLAGGSLLRGKAARMGELATYGLQVHCYRARWQVSLATGSPETGHGIVVGITQTSGRTTVHDSYALLIPDQLSGGPKLIESNSGSYIKA
jgi:hypothetical protein